MSIQHTNRGNMFGRQRTAAVIVLLCLCAAAILFSLTMYVIYLCGLIRADRGCKNKTIESSTEAAQ